MLESLKQSLSENIAQVSGLDGPQTYSLVEKPRNLTHGDLAFPCFLLAKQRKEAPPKCAAWLAQHLELPQGFESAQALGPFVNFRYNKKVISKLVLEAVLSESCPEISKQNVVIDYSSPNIAKPFHVGHLRATLIGNCLDRVYRELGHQTISVNHLGDWGTQFGFVWAGCKLWGEPEAPSVSALVELYRKATGLKEQQEKESVDPEHQGLPDVNEIARKYFVDLESGEDYAVKFWQNCVDISLEYLKKTYQRLSITFDHYTGESFYSDKVEPVKQQLEQAGLLVESKGAIGVDLGEDLGFARISTPDGRSLYLARDLAAVEYRAGEFNFDKALYVVGAPQALHFQQIKEVFSKLEKDYAAQIIHVAFGHVMGMKTRGGGNFIELNEFLDEAFKRSLDAYHNQVSKRPEGLDESEVAEAVSLAAIIFSNLSKSNIKDVHFSWDHALEFQGDTGPYLLYACARVSSIEEKVGEVASDVDYGLLTEDSAHHLLMALAEFSNVLIRTTEDNEPSYLANYALEIAKLFSKAYNELKVVGVEPELSAARLKLFVATKKVLQSSLELMGMKTLDRM